MMRWIHLKIHRNFHIWCDDSKRLGEPAASLHVTLMPVNPKQYTTDHSLRKWFSPETIRMSPSQRHSETKSKSEEHVQSITTHNIYSSKGDHLKRNELYNPPQDPRFSKPEQIITQFQLCPDICGCGLNNLQRQLSDNMLQLSAHKQDQLWTF